MLTAESVYYKMIYKPREDSLLLKKYVSKYSKGLVLDIGTGSGILAVEAAKKAKKVVGVDIDEKAVKYCKKNAKNKKIRFVKSDLFKNVKGKFDFIVFNPPYLPEDKMDKDKALDGGKKGYEVIERFLVEVNEHLKPNGKVLLLFSSLTNKEKVEQFINRNLLESKLLEEKSFFFEKLYVYLLSKSNILKKLEKRFSNIRYLAKGHRGLLFTALYKKKKVTIKIKNPESEAVGRISNETDWLKKLNKARIGPKLLFKDKEYFAYNYIEGDFILDFIRKAKKKEVIDIIKNVFGQMFVLDKLGVNKEEMHHPVKHVIIGKSLKVTLLDFERCHKSLKPKNVTQFVQFVSSSNVQDLLKKKRVKVSRSLIRKYAAKYKKERIKDNLNNILDCIE
ncbi:hypothetical protein CMO89_03185 [Candidatus Woesearchaeota archaeon]|nr:hypothetical protein [Candidatus Woesearchaeota archaeon]